MTYAVTLRSERCPDGVELFERPAPRISRKGPATIVSKELEGYRPTMVRYRTTRREPVFRRLERLDNPLVNAFLQRVPDPTKALLHFLAEYGLPFASSPPGAPCELEKIVGARDAVAAILASYDAGKHAEAIEQFDAIAVTRLGAISPSLFLRGDLRPGITLAAGSLFSYILLETATIMAGGARIMRCGHCASMFVVGEGTGRRRTSLWCSDRCRVAAQRARAASKAAGPGHVHP